MLRRTAQQQQVQQVQQLQQIDDYIKAKQAAYESSRDKKQFLNDIVQDFDYDVVLRRSSAARKFLLKLIASNFKAGIENCLHDILKNLSYQEGEKFHFFERLLIQSVKREPDWLDVNDNNKNSLLHLAAGFGFLNIVNFLADKDIDTASSGQFRLLVNAENNNRETPLLLALKAGHEPTIKSLLFRNASFYYKKDEQGVLQKSQFLFAPYLRKLLQYGQLVTSSYLQKILTAIDSKKDKFSDGFKLREYLNQAATALIGLTGKEDLSLKGWAEMYANGTSQDTEICTIENCFQSGSQFGISVNYLIFHVRALLELWLTDPKDRQDVEKELLIAINTAKIDQETTLLQLNPDDPDLQEAHLQGLMKRLQVQKYLCYPGGWPGSTGQAGHAVYIEILPTTIKVFNLGAGIDSNYNSSLFLKDANSALPAIKTITLTNDEMLEFLDGLVWANLNGVNDKTIKKSISKIYHEDIFERIVETESSRAQAEIIQQTGNCIVKNYLFSMRGRLGNRKYAEIYLDILNIVLEQIQSYCGDLPSSAVIVRSLRNNESVFSSIVESTIKTLKVFNNPSQACLATAPEPSQADLIGGLSSFWHREVSTHYHRGEKFTVEDVPHHQLRLW